MTYKKEHLKTIEKFVLQLMDKYSKRKSNFEPLTKILGDYANDTFLRAVRNVLFDKVELLSETGAKHMWVITRHNDCPRDVNYCTWVARKIVDEKIRLVKMIWLVNRWGDPYLPHIAIKFDISPIACSRESYATFKMRCENKMAEYVGDVNLRNELLHAIYDYGQAMNTYGYSEAKVDEQSRDKDILIKVYNDIEFGLSGIKNIIDRD